MYDGFYEGVFDMSSNIAEIVTEKVRVLLPEL